MAIYKVTSKIEANWTEWEGFVVRAPSEKKATRLIQDKLAKDWPGRTEDGDRFRFCDQNIIVAEVAVDGEPGIILEANRGS